MATQPFIDFKEVKDQSDFTAVLDFYGLAPGRRGTAARSFKIACPFHDDTEPSLSIDPAKKRFHCFGCGIKGNILEFVAEMEGLDRKTELRPAAEKLAAICGIDLAPERSTGRRRRPKERVRSEPRERPPLPPAEPPRAPSLERNPGCYALKFVEPDHPYLAERGLTPELCEEFGIGFYAGKGSMRGRIVIPIHDWWPDDPEESRLVAYIGRWPENDGPSGEPRYRTPAEFKKSQVLYNLHRVAGARHLYLVEGCFDAVAMHAASLPAVALMGNSLAPEQRELLWRAGARYVTVLMDGNAEGRNAAPAVLEALGERGFFARIAHLPEGVDPASADPDTLKALHRLEP